MEKLKNQNIPNMVLNGKAIIKFKFKLIFFPGNFDTFQWTERSESGQRVGQSTGLKGLEAPRAHLVLQTAGQKG